MIVSKGGFGVLTAIFGWFAVYLLTYGIPREKKRTRLASRAVGAFVGLNWGVANWDTLLKYINKVSTSVTDPIIGKNTGFYLFGLPFYDTLYDLLILLSLVGVAATVFSIFIRIRAGDIDFEPPEEHEGAKYRPLFVSGTWGKSDSSRHPDRSRRFSRRWNNWHGRQAGMISRRRLSWLSERCVM